MLTLTRDQCRAIDQRAVDQLGVPSILLMENAARSAAQVIHHDRPGVPADILCGGGNNGGDGYALARHLSRLGHCVTIHAVRPIDSLTGDALVNARICAQLHLPIVTNAGPAADPVLPGPIVIDALLGTGFGGGAVRAPIADAIRRINASSGLIVALDVPSGLDCDSGQPADPTVRADLTITFAAMKTGYGTPQAQPYVGRVIVGDIGLPPAWFTSPPPP